MPSPKILQYTAFLLVGPNRGLFCAPKIYNKPHYGVVTRQYSIAGCLGGGSQDLLGEIMIPEGVHQSFELSENTILLREEL